MPNNREPYLGFWHPFASHGWRIFEFLHLCEQMEVQAVITLNSAERPEELRRKSETSLLQARKKSTNQNFRVRIFTCGVGVFHVKGWGPKRSACPSKPGKSIFLGRDIPGFGWDILAVPEKFEKKKFVFNFWALLLGTKKSTQTLSA